MTIQQLSQEIGIGVDTLRVWERRYGFPVPARDDRGHRSYSPEQLEELRVVKNLLNYQSRPGKIFALDPAQRRRQLALLSAQSLGCDRYLQDLIETMTPAQIGEELTRQRLERGLPGFVTEYVKPLLQQMDHGWINGHLSIAREHLISDQLENILHAELAVNRPHDGVRILFLTLSGERHKLGLLLAAILFQQAGTRAILLREDLPLSEIPGLVSELGVVGIALSFSHHYGLRQAKQDLGVLRRNLDPAIKIIAGGKSVERFSSAPNVHICTDLAQIPRLVKRHFS